MRTSALSSSRRASSTFEVTVETAAQSVAFVAVLLMMCVWIASTLYLGKAMKKKEQGKEVGEQLQRHISVGVEIEAEDAVTRTEAVDGGESSSSRSVTVNVDKGAGDG